MELDKKDKKILQILQENSREQLKIISNKIGLSIDSTHKRIKKLKENKIIYPTINIDPRKVGYPIIADLKIRLRNITNESKKEFIDYLLKNSLCTDLLEIMGNFDFTCVFIASSSESLSENITALRVKFKEIIDEIQVFTLLKTHKFNWYDLK